jgi:GGDEF domain-containing protein
MASQVADAMRRISFLSSAGSITLSGSVGVSAVDARHPELADYLLRVADEAMYAQKHTAPAAQAAGAVGR